MLVNAPLARAQLGGGSAVDIVSDEVTLPTADQAADSSLSDIDTQDQSINQSLTTATSGSTYSPVTGTISSLDQGLFAGVNAQNVDELLPVTTPLPCDSYFVMLTDATALRKTYRGAINLAQQQEAQLQQEDFGTIAANIQSSSQLAATQGVGQAVLASVQESQLLRESINALILVIATDKLHQLDSTVRSRMPRAGGGC